MSHLLALDPGIRGCGVAVFVDGRLFSADYVKSPARAGNRGAECVSMARAVVDYCDVSPDCESWEVALEWPQIYASTRDKDPNDLLALCGIGSAVAINLAGESDIATYLPREWKGQMKKEACHARTRTRLDEVELNRAAAGAARAGKDMAHNMWDAVGIGLHRLGRLAPRRVITS